MENPDWVRLGEAVLARRHVLGVSQEDLVRHGGPSNQSIRNIESGSQSGYRPLTLSKLENVLGWKSGTCQTILDGTADPDPDSWVDHHQYRTVHETAHASDSVGAPDWIQRRTVQPGTAESRSVVGNASVGLTGTAVLSPSGDLDTTAGTIMGEGIVAVSRVGFEFLELLDKHYGNDPRATRTGRAVVDFIREILNGAADGPS